MSERIEQVQPEGWARPRGYSNGFVSRGRTLHLGGQVGWGPDQVFVADDMVGQFAQALDNIVAVVRAAGGEPTDLVQMTIFVTDVEAYRSARRELGRVWRERLGKHFPAMALVGVTALVEPEALVEIQSVAALPE